MRLIQTTNPDFLLPLLHDAEEGDDRIRAALDAPGAAGYLALDDAGERVGAALMRWEPDESELVYIGIAAGRRGQGLGRVLVAALLDEARRRGARAVIVGTANSSLDNIAFYQKCGFRMASIRRGFFDYLPRPVFEDGIRMRDMIVFRWEDEPEG